MKQRSNKISDAKVFVLSKNEREVSQYSQAALFEYWYLFGPLFVSFQYAWPLRHYLMKLVMQEFDYSFCCFPQVKDSMKSNTTI